MQLPEATDARPMLAIDAFRQDAWTRQDPRLPNDWPPLPPHWHRDHALRTAYARRQALVDEDVLAATALCPTLAELQTVHRVQFPAMRQYEAETHYDTNSRIVFTSSKAPPAVGLPRKAMKGNTGLTPTTPEGTKEGIALAWEHVRNLDEGAIIGKVTDGTHRGCPAGRQLVYSAHLGRGPTSAKTTAPCRRTQRDRSLSTLDDVIAKCDHLVETRLWPREQELPYHRWIRNFPQDQQLAAAQLLGQLIYVNLETTRGALTSAYQRLIRSLSSVATNSPAVSMERIETSHTSIVVTPIRGESPNVADSAFTYMREARNELRLNESQLVGDLATAVGLATSTNKVLVLIDDIVGSGEQLISTIQAGCDASPQVMMDQGRSVVCLVAAITSHALARIESEHPKLLVFAGHVLDVESYSIQSLLPEAQHANVYELLRSVAPRLQVKDYIDPIYGFNRFGFTLAFHDNIPDFSLPIFWARGGADWVPLKSRYDE